MKTCSKCQESKPLDAFKPSYATKSGAWCKACTNAYRKEKRYSDPVWAAKQNARVAATRLPRCNRGDEQRKLKYGMSQYDYQDMLDAQDFRCLICHKQHSPENVLAVDHDHACCPGKKSCGNCIRGLLCRNCNTGLGYFRDDPQLLQAAIRYLA